MTKERRESFRCQTGGEELPLEGVLHTRRGDVTVKLTNRSSGGFGVLVPKGSRTQVNDNEEIAFTVGAGSSLVRVAHQSEAEEGIVVGLEILRELPIHMSKNYAKRRTAARGSSQFLRYAILTTCVVVIALNVPWNRAFSAFRIGEESNKTDAEARQENINLFAPSDDRSSELQLANRFVQLDQLTSQQAIARLNLSGTQQREISSIVKETTSSMEILFKNRESISDAEWTTLGLSLLQNSARRIEATLNEQQRAEWANLTRQIPAERGVAGSQ